MKLVVHSLFAVATIGLVAACAAKPPPPPAVAQTTSAVTVAPAKTPEPAQVPEEDTCEVSCGTVQIVTPDYHAASIANARAVIDAMHDELMACYKQRVREDPGAYGSPIFDIVIDPEGHVLWIHTTGGARLGKKAMTCMTSHLMKAKFAPVPGGGTQHIQVPLILRHANSPDRDDDI